MRRIIVAGGHGFFGNAAVELLRADGFPVRIASRRSNDLPLNVEDRTSLTATLHPSDIVVDAAGPFQSRSTLLVEKACEIGCDVIDISDSLDYTRRVYELRTRIQKSGIRVLTACSSISAVSACAVLLSGIRTPARLRGFLAPASRYASNAGAGASLLRSVGRPITVLRHGMLVRQRGWIESRWVQLPPPFGAVRACLFESADAVTLPEIWPTLRTVDFYVHTNVPLLDTMLGAGARFGTLRQLIEKFQAVAYPMARHLGREHGCLAYEVEGEDAKTFRLTLFARNRGYYTPVVPAVMAAEKIARGEFPHVGLVPPHQHVNPQELVSYLERTGIHASSRSG